MKKLLTVILAMTMLLNCGVIVASAENINMQVDENIQSTFPVSEEYYVSPIQPGSDDWDELSIHERYTATSIDAAYVATMTTDAVLLSALNYPFIINIYVYDDINEGIEAVRLYCPALDELIGRSDAIAVVAGYLQACRDQGITDTTSYYVATRIYGYLSSMADAAPYYLVDPETGYRMTYLYTPNESEVLVYVSIPWDDVYTYDEAYSVSLDMEEAYGVTMIRNPDSSYNCHSYAWHSTATNNPYWMEDPTPYTTDGSYTRSTAEVNNKITYKRGNGTYCHSGIVTGNGEITSKWGKLGLFKHGVTNNPYIVETASIDYWTLS